MKKIFIYLLLIAGTCHAQQSPTFKQELFGKSNIVHVGKRGYIEKDKFLHSTVGAFVGSSVYMYSYYRTDRRILSMALSVLSSFVVGEIKELHDRNNGGRFSNDDIAATTFGGFSGVFTKIIQIDIQEKNKALSEEQKQKYENLTFK
jgi:hypothetical protein